MSPITCATTASLTGPAGGEGGDTHIVPARSPSVGGIPSRAIGLPGIMVATLEVSPAGHLVPNLATLLLKLQTYPQIKSTLRFYKISDLLPLNSLFLVHFSHSVTSCSLWPHGLQHARLPCPSPTPNSRSLLKLMSINSLMPSNHLILCLPLLLPSSIFSGTRDFSNESVLPIRWPKYWSFSFSISPSSEYSGLISFRIDWFDLSPKDS